MIIKNRRASFDYFLKEKIEAGISLEGWEVKSIRAGKISISESYITIRDNQVYLFGCHIIPLSQASSHQKNDPTRIRKLLLNKREIIRLTNAVERDGYTCISVQMYWKNGKVKLEIATSVGKKAYDKRTTQRDNDLKREASSAMKFMQKT